MDNITDQNDIDSLLSEGNFDKSIKINRYDKNEAEKLIKEGGFVQRVSEHMEHLSPVFFLENGQISCVESKIDKEYINKELSYNDSPWSEQPENMWAEIDPTLHPCFEKQEFYLSNRFSPEDVSKQKDSISNTVSKEIMDFISNSKTVIIETKIIVVDDNKQGR